MNLEKREPWRLSAGALDTGVAASVSSYTGGNGDPSERSRIFRQRPDVGRLARCASTWRTSPMTSSGTSRPMAPLE